MTNSLPQRSFETVHVFDIATNTWFAQPTTAEAGFYPTDRLGFCTVVASAEDNSSHNIYLYGGYLPSQGPLTCLNDVFILTLPAFHWVSVYPSVNDTSDLDIRKRSQHKCEKLHEKYLVAYRGNNAGNDCDYEKGRQKFQGLGIFDMSSLEWTTKMELGNPEYLVPPVLSDIVGGK